jgi:uncharacterized membrane-anchored protein
MKLFLQGPGHAMSVEIAGLILVTGVAVLFFLWVLYRWIEEGRRTQKAPRTHFI